MRLRNLMAGAAFCAATTLWGNAVYSQAKDEKKPEAAKSAATTQSAAAKPADKPATATPPTAAKPVGDMPAAGAPGGAGDPHMDAWVKAATPGEAHAKLKATEGSWNTVTKHWHDLASQPMESKGTCERKWIMDGRYMEEHYSGDFMGMPFKGMGIGGYDNVQKKYVTTWIDNMGTGIMLFTGTADAPGKVFNYTGDYADPMTGKMQKMRSVMRIVDDKSHIFEMYGPGEDGKEFKMMEVTHTRK